MQYYQEYNNISNPGQGSKATVDISWWWTHLVLRCKVMNVCVLGYFLFCNENNEPPKMEISLNFIF